MANRTKTNPIYIDQFNANVTLATKGIPFILRKIIMLSATDGDDFVLEDIEGNVIAHLSNNVGNADTVSEMYDDLRCMNGVKITVANCTGMAGTDGTDAVWIYLA